MGESASARTQRELADLRAAIGRDADALVAQARDDVDPRRLVRRRPLAVLGSLASVTLAAGVAVVRRIRESRQMDQRVDVLIESLGGRIDKLKGKARKRFRYQLRKEMAEVEPTGPKDVAIGVLSALLTALATTMARGFGKRLLGDDTTERDDR